VTRYPGRFFGFTTATFTRPVDQPLFTDHRCFVDETIGMLRDHVHRGARGLKILKELGLRYRDGGGAIVFADDPRLTPVWDEAASLGVPVLIHQADPYGFFEPVTPDNEHYGTMLKYPSWSFADPVYPRFDELQLHCRNLVRNHPRTTFILPHVANYPENLAFVAELLDACPNVHIDLSARLDELGRQPRTARQFIIKYQDRILFGTDMPATTAMYRFYFRFLETFDEYFIPPDYDGTFDRHRWRVCGIGLPDDVLKKIYHGNARRLMPGIADVAT
jgi:predicted TIM-barrel fold metal-dependent hydrolase